ncbi:MAG: hypothetical protein EAZ44_05110 [Cytophagia bacterium]|nr:MAG: hypothetical protein EAZ44_05110 [Cytophagia bacterium]
MSNLYEILEVSAVASQEEIKASYKKLALKYHPDRNPDNEQAEEHFKLVAHAYQILSNENNRRQYDYQQSITNLYQKNQNDVFNTQTFYNPPTPPETYTIYPPYENGYDPVNHITRRGQKRILFGTIIVLSLFIIGALFFGYRIEYSKSEAQYKSAQSFFDKGEIKLALVQVSASIRFKPNLQASRLLRAKIYRQYFFNPFNAIEDYTYLIKNNPPTIDYYILRAKTYKEAYQKEKALEDLKKVIELNPKGNYQKLKEEIEKE